MSGLLAALPTRWRQDHSAGLPSVCSAHPMVIEAVLEGEGPVLIEATCNQVNQEGGYTGMTPGDFRRSVAKIADRAGFPMGRIVLGGDHLGPNPWKDLEPDEAMTRARRMVADYVRAGFHKLHLDASMGCRGEPPALADELVAERAALLASAAEAAAEAIGGEKPRYVIGTEVPVPGGASHAIAALQVTSVAAVERTLEAHRRAFAAAGAAAAFDRVVAVVVQPGVEFDRQRVFVYEPAKAKGLAALLEREAGIVFEAHSTDYQPAAALKALVADGFAILKVGPGLTFALREGLYGLDRIAAELRLADAAPGIEATLEELMLADPRYWQPYYHGAPAEERILRHYSYSDRIRYYWPAAAARAAVDRLFSALAAGAAIPETLVSQFLPGCYPAVRDGRIEARPRPLVLEAIRRAVDAYRAAASSPAAG
jgi:D-tagatose-1,6-bisphosphate aldolase subunit GatZ/KbaZ